jgi:acetylornithine deacetylase/succinyl-diaminopimelate desuccinylase-like protein
MSEIQATASAPVAETIERGLDRAYLVETVSRLAQIPTDVPLGFDTLIEPDDPKLVHYVQDVVRPELARLGCHNLLDVPRNNLVVQVGSGESGRSLLIQNYTPAQHHNLMEDPFSGKIANARAYGRDEPAVFGRGVSQAKAHQAVMLAVLKLLGDQDIALRGRLYWAVNNEGRSSHACSTAIVEALDPKPSFGIVQHGTGLAISLGNRGRVDVLVHVEGKVSHSSAPDKGLSAIDGAHQVIERLKSLAWPDRHPHLGGRQAIAYKIRYAPEAPHTLPSDAFITIDRRMIPGDDPTVATDEIRAAIGDLSPYRVTVTEGVHMLPALVDADDPGVRALQSAHTAQAGRAAEIRYGQGTFDAGGPCALGVPTVMYGVSGGIWPTGIDFVTISDVETEARVLAHLILSELA